MNKLFDIYGHCVIPQDTFLFRGHDSNAFDDCMFFATKLCVAGAFKDSVQVWKTTTDIRVLFLIDHLDDRSWATSSLPQLYNNLFQSNSNFELSDLDIKHKNLERREKLVRRLFDEYQVSGWLTSLDGKVELEVCLFDKKANKEQLVLADAVDRRNKRYFKDSLERISISPPQDFLDKTRQKLDARAPVMVAEQDHSKRYLRGIEANIKEEMEKGKSREEATHYFMNLRIKMKLCFKNVSQ